MNLASIQTFCHGLKGTTEDLKWGCDICFSVSKKMYAVLGIGEGQTTKLCFKVTPENFELLTKHPEIVPAPYLARHHWVCLLHTDVLTDRDLKERLTDSYMLVFNRLPKKLQRAIGEA